MGSLRDRNSTEVAYQNVTHRGLAQDDASLVMTKEARPQYLTGTDTASTERGRNAPNGAGVGSALVAHLARSLLAVPPVAP